MVGTDEIIFSGAYKDFKLGVHYNLDGKKPEEIAQILGFLSSEIEPYAFRFSGIDTKEIDDFAKPDGKGISSICDFLEKKSSEWNRMIKNLDNKLLKPVADSYLLNRLLTNAGVAFKVTGKEANAEKEEIENQIAFIGKFGNWIAIKKLSTDKAKDYEVSGILSAINFTVVNKAYEFAGVEMDETVVKAATKGKRKSLSNVVDALKALGSKADNPYVVCKVLEELGYRPYASSHMLTNAYPDIKPPKVKGRKPKG